VKLADIDAEQLARDQLAAALGRVQSALTGLDCGGYEVYRVNDGPPRPAVYDGSDWAHTTAGHAVYCLTRYAQRGDPLDADVHEYLVSLIPLDAPEIDDLSSDVDGPLALVCQAALAREAIDGGHRVGTVWLAALAGVTPLRVRQLAAAGEIAAQLVESDRGRERYEVKAAEARRWLSARGVLGFAR